MTFTVAKAVAIVSTGDKTIATAIDSQEFASSIGTEVRVSPILLRNVVDLLGAGSLISGNDLPILSSSLPRDQTPTCITR